VIGTQCLRFPLLDQQDKKARRGTDHSLSSYRKKMKKERRRQMIRTRSPAFISFHRIDRHTLIWLPKYTTWHSSISTQSLWSSLLVQIWTFSFKKLGLQKKKTLESKLENSTNSCWESWVVSRYQGGFDVVGYLSSRYMVAWFNITPKTKSARLTKGQQRFDKASRTTVEWTSS
jgi:hypothetical protein